MKKIYLFFIIVTILASIGINLKYLFSQSIRLDEAQSVWVSTKSVFAILKISAQDVQVPLYSLLLHFWMQLFGTDIVIARLLSLVFFVLTVPYLYVLIRDASNHSVAILGVVLFTLSPFILWYSQEARTYTLLTLLATANHVYFLRTFESKARKHLLGYFLTSLLGIYSHYFFVFLLLSQLFFLGYYYLRRHNRSYALNSSHRRFIYSYLATGMLLVLFFIPWLIYVYRLGLAAYTQPLIVRPTTFNLLQVYVNFFLGFQVRTIQSLTVALWPLFLMILFYIFTRKLQVRLARLDYFFLVSFLPVMVIFFLSFYRPIFLPRYLIFVVPSLFTLMAWILINAGRKIFSALTVSILGLMLVSLNFQNSSQGTPVKEDYRDVVTTLTQQTTPRDIIVVSAPFTVYPIEYYYSGLARIDTIPQWNRYVEGPVPPYKIETLTTQIDQYASIYYRMFVVLSYDQGYQSDIVDYLDHHYQLLNQSLYPATINLRVYQLRYDELLKEL